MLFRGRRIRRAVEATLPLVGRAPLDETPVQQLKPGERVDAWVMLADRLLELDDDPARARAPLERAVREDPAHWDAWALLAQIEQQTPGRRAAAIDAYRRLHEFGPGVEAVSVELAILLLEEGRVEEARLVYQELPSPLTDAEAAQRLDKAFRRLDSDD